MATDAIQPLTALALFKAVQYEIHKVEAPSFDLEEFNYFVNRAQLEYANLRYNLYETTQQLTDDLRALKRELSYSSDDGDLDREIARLPADYFHAERVKVSFTVNTAFECYRVGSVITKTAKRLTADLQGYVEQPNYYARPDYRRPYWRILQNGLYIESGLHANLDLTGLTLQYLRTPRKVTLYQDDTDDPTNDSSQLLDWPAYVCNELAKVLVKLFLENTSNARLQSFPLINQSIPNQSAQPASSQQPAQPQQSSTASE